MDRLAHWFYCCVRAILRLFPVSAVFALGRFGGSIAYHFAGPYRKLALRNLEIAFGREKSASELRRLARQHFASLGGNLLASVRMADVPRDRLKELVTLDGFEIADAIIREKRGIVMVISHIGNWELFAQLMPVLFTCPLGTIYQRLGNPHLDAEMRTLRARLGLQLFERKEGFQGALQVLRAGGIVGVLIDQHAGDGGVWCPFFDRLASTSSLAAMLALRTGAALVPGAVYTEGCGRWRLHVRPPVEPASRHADEVTAQLNLVLAEQIRDCPADWFWVHNRWKTPKPKFLLATYKRGIAYAPTQAARPQERASADSRHFRLVIRAPNWLGDAVMSVPAVEAIKLGRPDLFLAVLTPEKLADFWRAVPSVDEVIAISSRESVFGVARKLRGRFDAAILFPNSLRSALEAWLAGIPRRVGYPGHRRRRLLNQVFEEKKKKPEAPKHQVHRYLRLAEFIGADVPQHPKFPSAAPRPRTEGPLRIAICPGAEYGPAKRWLPKRFQEVMDRFSEEGPCEWFLVGAGKDATAGQEVAMGFSGNLRNLIGQTSLAQLIELLRSCDLVLTNDTGGMHLAAWLGIPLVAVFGSTEPSLTGPLSTNASVVRKHVPCSPCFLRECPIDFRCMKGVEADDVLNAMRELLAR